MRNNKLFCGLENIKAGGKKNTTYGAKAQHKTNSAPKLLKTFGSQSNVNQPCFELIPIKSQEKEIMVTNAWVVNYQMLIITVENKNDGQKSSFYVKSNNNNNNNASTLEKFADGNLYVRDVSCTDFTNYLVDNADDLWIMGQQPYKCDTTVLKNVANDDRHSEDAESTPQEIIWFKNKGLKVRDIKSCSDMAIFRMYKGAPDNEHFYCIPRIQKDNDTRIQLEEKCIGMAGFESLSTDDRENF